MVGSSPARRKSYQWASPARSVMSDIMGEDRGRNSEAAHLAAIESARRNQELLREDALRIYGVQVQKEQQLRVMEEKKREEERIAREQQLADERKKLIELRAKQVKIPPLPPPEPEPVPQPRAVITPVAPAPGAVPGGAPTIAPSLVNNARTGQSTIPPTGLAALTLGGPKPLVSTQPATSSPLGFPKPAGSLPPPQAASTAPGSISSILNKAPTLQDGGSAAQSKPQPPAPAKAPAPQVPDRYLEIHKNVEVLRLQMEKEAEGRGGAWKRLGEMRRELRMRCGQLSIGTGVNKIQVRWLMDASEENQRDANMHIARCCDQDFARSAGEPNTIPNG